MITLLKICGIGILSVILIGLLKSYKPELAIILTLCTSLIMIAIIIESIGYSLQFMEVLYGNLSYGKDYFPIIIKVLAIAYITEFAAALCNDAGEKAIGSKIELAGKVAIFFTAIPVFLALLELINGLII